MQYPPTLVGGLPHPMVLKHEPIDQVIF